MQPFQQYRPASHFIAPHSWSNDPCGAIYVPETREYLICYQWNPGTTVGGNCAWGMAKSKDLVTWTDCPPAIWNGATYDRKGVFSGSIQSVMVDGKRVLLLFYTSVSALPIHWSKPYLHGCESQSLAVSMDYGKTWSRHQANPLLSTPPHGSATTGWRDPFVSPWSALSELMGLPESTSFMMLASGERQKGPQLELFMSNDLQSWEPVSTLLSAKKESQVSATSSSNWGVNFECASFFSLNGREYLIVGVEEEDTTRHHNGHYLLWLVGDLVMVDGRPRFQVTGHGVLDHGILYAAHIFRDAQGRLLQLGWADETAKPSAVSSQGWAGCLGHPRELFEITKPVDESCRSRDEWLVDEEKGTMTTLAVRPAPQVDSLRSGSASGLSQLPRTSSKSFEIKASFTNLQENEKLVFNVLSSPDMSETTGIIFDMSSGQVIIDRSRSSLSQIGTSSPEVASLNMLPGEDLQVRVFVDNSIVEVFVNERIAMITRVYPVLPESTGISYDLGNRDENKIALECWTELKNAWPDRASGHHILGELHPLRSSPKMSEVIPDNELHRVPEVPA
ncbi:Arabinanase/levansucrase/invertase [Sarocladium implicatum]|nr:Arabinanase/levansucrase/invertase [Sarocladium implicatum]